MAAEAPALLGGMRLRARSTAFRKSRPRCLVALIVVVAVASVTLLGSSGALAAIAVKDGRSRSMIAQLRHALSSSADASGGETIARRPPHLVGFYAEQSLEARRMRYLGSLLEEELPEVHILWLEAWENPLNERLRAIIDLRGQCGGVPYLFNRRTGKVLCGVVSYDKLRMLE
eukprot:TRINITY_DN12017_c0_g1_i2.p1 TRINITY_DN12017_c0_g1~~TRINITY_DN12017_c0_g1_i2.p1  ORF type:complete len:173 (-),score=33.97 TRINITY_DN12017_c0_g1_i2:213-731(-)